MTNGQTRRTALGAMAAGVGMAGVGLMGMTDQTTAQAQTGGKTFVLVHGAWHGGWCWRRVSDLLEKQGPQGVRAHDDGARRALAPDRRQDRSRDPRHRHRQRDQMGEPQRHRAGRPLLWRRDHLRRRRADARGDRLDRVPRRLRAGERRQPGGQGLAARARSDRGIGGEGRDRDEAGAGRGVPGEREGPGVGRRHVHAPSGGDAHRQDHVDRRARRASPRRPISAPRVIRACRSTASTTRSRPTAHGASTSCPAATTSWSTCPTG